MIPGRRGLLLLAGLLGASGVALAAVGAHLIDAAQPWADWRSWQSANNLHLFHALALLGLAALCGTGAPRWPGVVGLFMTAGVLMFCFSIYASIAFSLGGAGPIAPLGGSTLILSWLLLAVLALRASR